MSVNSPAALRFVVSPLRSQARFTWPSPRRLRPILLPAATAAALLAVWQLVVAGLAIPAVILPPPGAVAGELWHSLPLLVANAVPTTRDTLLAFGIATLLGVGIAVVLAYSPLLRDTLYPNLIAFQLVPKVALAPLFVVWLGVGSVSHVAFAAFVSFFPILISTALGLASVEPSALRLCRALTASEWQCFVAVRFPFALPAIFSGMKVAMTMATIGVIIAEFISSKAGLGYYVLFASSRMETANVFAALFMLCAVGVALFGAVALAEALVRRAYGRR